jgi:hypothetical protein
MSALDTSAVDAATIRALAEALADVLVERGLVVERTAGPVARVLDVAQVAVLLGRKPAWVYAHARELGAFRFGDGPKARLGFDRASVERWKRDRLMRNAEGDSGSRRGRSRQDGRSRGASLIPYETLGEDAYHGDASAPR